MFKKNDLVIYTGFNRDTGAPDLPKGTLAIVKTVHSGGEDFLLQFIEDNTRSGEQEKRYYDYECNYYFPVQNFRCITRGRD